MQQTVLYEFFSCVDFISNFSLGYYFFVIEFRYEFGVHLQGKKRCHMGGYVKLF